MSICLPEDGKWVRALSPQADGALQGDWVSLKNAHTCFVMIEVKQANAAQATFSINQATVVAGTDTKVLAKNVPIWSNLDCAASDALVRRTDAVNYQLDAGLKEKMVIFQIHAEALDLANNFDCINVASTGSDATNIIAAQYYLCEDRYAEATPPSAIID